MNVKRGRVLRGFKSIVYGALALGLAACSMPKLPSLGGPLSNLRRWTAMLLIARGRVCSLREPISNRRCSLQTMMLNAKPS